jgi:hypothetical protein
VIAFFETLTPCLMPHRHGSLRYSTPLGSRADEARP